MKKAIIVDLDGTLANVEHRVHFVQCEKEKKDWKSFNAAMEKDSLHLWCKELIDAIRDKDYLVLFVTGRGDDYREKTQKWLKDHQVIYDELFMRRAQDFRSDHIIKGEIYEELIAPLYEILFVVDDRQSVVKMWRDKGLVCLQCDWGDF